MTLRSTAAPPFRVWIGALEAGQPAASAVYRVPAKGGTRAVPRVWVGDVLVGVNGYDVRGLPIDPVLVLLASPPPLRLTFVREHAGAGAGPSPRPAWSPAS